MDKILRKKYALLPLLFFGFSLPLVSQAQGGCAIQGDNTISKIIEYVTCMLSTSILTLVISLAVIAFIYGVVQFIRNADNPEKRTEGGKAIAWSIVGLFVIFSIWGIVAFIQNTLSIGAT